MGIVFALIFYSVFSLFALVGLPLVMRVTSDLRLAFCASKIAGLAVCAYVVWLGSLLTLIDYQNRWLIRGVLAAFVIAGAVTLWKSRARLKWKGVLWIEAISIALYAFYLFVRSYHPSADGTEHFMDMALLTAAGKTHSFPFVDPWYAGKLVNYYYYGSYVVSLIANLSGTPYATAYNLALGLAYSQTALLAGVLVYAVTGFKKFGVLAGFLVTTAGTLYYGQCAIRGALSTPATTCPYMSSTRLYDPSFIINEIPSYSFIVGNLHAHVLALPFFLMGLILLYVNASEAKPKLAAFLLTALSLATSGMVNSWDAITLFCLLGTLILLKLYEHHSDFRAAAAWAAFGVGMIVVVAVLMAPALSHFESPVLGVGFGPSYFKSHGLHHVQYPTPLGAQAGIWGAYLLAIVLAFARGTVGIRQVQFVATLAIAAVGILVGVELFFIRDIYSLTNPPYFRANTTFKFGYQVWVILSIAFAVCVASASGRRSSLRRVLSVSCLLVIVGGAVFPLAAFSQYYWSSLEPRGLDASAWMAGVKGDRDTVRYINANVPERRVIAEAVGESYSRHGRMATFTGMITPMGWQWHEWTWRFRSGDAAKAPPANIAAMSWAPISITAQNIATLYKTHDPAEAKRLIELYGIDYVYVGELERQSYPDLDEAKFHTIGTVAFESAGSRLFAVR